MFINRTDYDKVNKSDFWDDKYINNEHKWDISGPTPAFVHWSKNLKSSKRIIVPGCGNGYDAMHLANQGHNVFAIDFSSKVINNLKNKKIDNLNVVSGDYFNLPSKFNNKFDYFLEYTFLCAINPDRRMEYIKKSFDLLNSQGVYIGFLFPINKPLSDGGPPFGIDIDKIFDMFSQFYYDIKIEKSKYSIDSRSENELFVTMKKNA